MYEEIDIVHLKSSLLKIRRETRLPLDEEEAGNRHENVTILFIQIFDFEPLRIYLN